MTAFLVGQLNATSIAGVPSSADATVTVQREWSVVATSAGNAGAAPDTHLAAAPSTVRHNCVEFIAVDDTTCTDTDPGPSLTNVKVRGAEGLSTDVSSTRSLKVIVAVGEV
jgi:hypothetical protein